MRKKLDIFLCRVGFHRWLYWRMSMSYFNSFPEDLGINRSCNSCGLMQCTDNGVDWMLRV